MSLPNVLIIAPHADDEVLGCGGLMASGQYNVTVVVVAAPCETRQLELESVARYLNFDLITLRYPDGHVGDSLQVLASSMATAIEFSKFDKVFIPYPSLHQDHISTNHASLISLRNYIGDIYEYEYPEGIGNFRAMEPNVGFELTQEMLDKKARAIELYNSQLVKYRDEDAIISLASIRGIQFKCKYAEGYRLIRGKL